ncbi:hypothetical protein GGI35DRAFT_153987 [Trichoderma velutinum]
MRLLPLLKFISSSSKQFKVKKGFHTSSYSAEILPPFRRLYPRLHFVMPYLETDKQSSIGVSSVDAADTWSTVARSDSPPPIARTSSRATTSTSAASTTEAPPTNNMRNDQNDTLHGIGSQFPAIGISCRLRNIFRCRQRLTFLVLH